MGVKLRERRPGEWWLYVDHQGKRFAKKLGHDKRQAAAIRREVERRLAAGDLGIGPTEAPTTPTLAEYADHFLTTIEHTLKYTTYTDYEISFRRRILPALGSKRLDEVTRLDVKTFALALRREGQSVRNVRKTIATLSSLFSEAVEDFHLKGNPATGLRKVFRSPEFHDSDQSQKVHPLTREELAHLLDTAQRHSIVRGEQVRHPYHAHYPFLLLLARTGLRLGEAAALRWGDVDLHGGFLEVRRAFVMGRLTTPKNKKTRRVDLSTQLRATLTECWRDRFERVVAIDAEAEAALAAERAGALDAYVFSPTDRPLDPDNFRRRVFEPLLTTAGLRKVRIHDLRHTWASLMIEAGKELHYIQAQLGHHSPSFTLSVYGHLLPRNRRGEVDCLDDGPIRNPDATTSGSRPATIRNSAATSAGAADPAQKEAPQPPEIAGHSRAGDRGRTGDLMLGKHTL